MVNTNYGSPSHPWDTILEHPSKDDIDAGVVAMAFDMMYIWDSMDEGLDHDTAANIANFYGANVTPHSEGATAEEIRAANIATAILGDFYAWDAGIVYDNIVKDDGALTPIWIKAT